MSDAGRSPEDWQRVYDDHEPLYSAFLDKLEALIGDLLDDADVSYEWITVWKFSRDNFFALVTREMRSGREFDDALTDLGFAGLRVVVDSKESANGVVEVMERNFAVLRRGLPWEELRDSARYEFPVRTVSIDETRAAVSEWRPYEGLVAQIDIQTVLQYAWELLDHRLYYYDEATYPTGVRRVRADFARLLQAADEAFADIHETLIEAEERAIDDVRSGHLEQELNGETLRAYLHASQTVATLIRIGVGAGLAPDDEDDLSPRGTMEQTLWLARRNGLKTLSDLDDFLASAMDRADRILADIARTTRERDFTAWALPESIVDWLLLVLQRADGATVALTGYADPIDDAINMLIGNPVPRREEP